MARPWFRMYAEAVDDEKLRLLAFEDRWHFVAILCLKCQGSLDSDAPHLDRRVALKLGLQLPQLDELKRRLMDVGLVTEEWQPVKWADRQFESDASAERTRAWRERNSKKRHRDVTVTAQDTDTDTEQNRTEKKTTAAAPPAWVADFQAIYPKRAGDPNWRGAWKAANARILEGYSPAEFIEGARRYAAYCKATGKVGQETVQQASRFLGPSKPFLLPWDLPATKAQQQQDANIDAGLTWLRQSGAA